MPRCGQIDNRPIHPRLSGAVSSPRMQQMTAQEEIPDPFSFMKAKCFARFERISFHPKGPDCLPKGSPKFWEVPRCGHYA